jgi:hypothetical protein
VKTVLRGVFNNATLNTFKNVTVTRHCSELYDDDCEENDLMTTSRFFGHELLFKTILDAESTNNTLTASVASIVEAVWFEMHAEETHQSQNTCPQ